MKTWWFGGIGACLLVGCGSGARVSEPSVPSSAKSDPTERHASSNDLEPGRARASRGTPITPSSSSSNALASPGIDDRFAVARQVAALERSIELYQMFIDRAGDDSRYDEAVRRSRGRIADAQVTICFLLEKPCDGTGDR